MSKKLNVFFLVISVFSILACSKTTDEAQIKQTIDKMSKAIEEGKPAAIAESLHEDFRANHDMNVQQVKQLLMMYGLQHKTISITIVSSRTRIDPVYTDRAESTLSVMTAGSSGGILPDDSSGRVVKLEWRKDGDWKVLKADWQE